MGTITSYLIVICTALFSYSIVKLRQSANSMSAYKFAHIRASEEMGRNMTGVKNWLEEASFYADKYVNQRKAAKLSMLSCLFLFLVWLSIFKGGLL